MGFCEERREIFGVVLVLDEGAVEIIFLFADILDPLFAASIAVNVAAIIFTFKNKNTFFGHDEQINFRSFAVASRNVNVAEDLALGYFELTDECIVGDALARLAGGAPFFGVADFVKAVTEK